MTHKPTYKELFNQNIGSDGRIRVIVDLSNKELGDEEFEREKAKFYRRFPIERYRIEHVYDLQTIGAISINCSKRVLDQICAEYKARLARKMSLAS